MNEISFILEAQNYYKKTKVNNVVQIMFKGTSPTQLLIRKKNTNKKNNLPCKLKNQNYRISFKK